MDEENLSQAIIIGVTTFISIMVISAIVAFYNSGVRIVRNTSEGSINYNMVNRKDVEASLLLSGTGKYIKGTAVVNILNNYLSDTDVYITVNNIKYMDETGNINVIGSISMDSDDVAVREASYDKLIRAIMDNQDFTIVSQDINTDLGSKIITIEGV